MEAIYEELYKDVTSDCALTLPFVPKLAVRDIISCLPNHGASETIIELDGESDEKNEMTDENDHSLQQVTSKVFTGMKPLIDKSKQNNFIFTFRQNVCLLQKKKERKLEETCNGNTNGMEPRNKKPRTVLGTCANDGSLSDSEDESLIPKPNDADDDKNKNGSFKTALHKLVLSFFFFKFFF
ncbi:hypothetical protein RFI_01329 [Reticulomyxa filosa]|uniref:Uncharacterized protein n=1 Tax=Reticulomyxa filosa TaxID=46433 RepID=X6PCA3_RETFI|nr:hypothetical protein RFI_01329 [Reticulomyxa filosa]|eukprot:ETO35733.1 hypothetical protein RFI_01329 [Reticulomyxa filosa]